MNTFLLIKKTVLRFVRKMKKDRISASAAESAFFIIMGLVPFFLLLLTILQYTYITQDMVLSLMNELLPDTFYGMIYDTVGYLFRQSTALVSTSIITSIWATSRSVLAITNGLNAVRDVKENRNYFYMRFRSAIFIVFLVIAVSMAMVLLLFGNRVQQALVEFAPAVGRLTGVIISFRMTFTLSMMALIFLALYCALPNCRMRVLRQIPGALFTAVFWSVSCLVFSIYFKYYAARSIYGSLTTVVILMLWLYFCMWSLFVGAEINCFLEYPEGFIENQWGP